MNEWMNECFYSYQEKLIYFLNPQQYVSASFFCKEADNVYFKVCD